MKAVLAAIILLSVTGCAGARVDTSGCEWAKKILVSPDDVLTDGTAKQVLTHNKTGAQICGWQKSTHKE